MCLTYCTQYHVLEMLRGGRPGPLHVLGMEIWCLGHWRCTVPRVEARACLDRAVLQESCGGDLGLDNCCLFALLLPAEAEGIQCS